MYKKDGSIDLRFLPKIIYRPLLKHGAEGLAWQLLHRTEDKEKDPELPTIEIDSRLRGRRKLDAEIHEALHLACPWMPERAVGRAASYLARVVWSLGYRTSCNSAVVPTTPDDTPLGP